MDHDAKFSEAFRITLKESGVEPVRLPPRSPNLSPHLERFMRGLKEECLERIIFFGETSLQSATVSFLDHYHAERNHQGIGNRLITPEPEVGGTTGEIACRERLGGTLRYYYRLCRDRNSRYYSEFRTMPSKDRLNCQTRRVNWLPGMYCSVSTRHSPLPMLLRNSPVFGGMKLCSGKNRSAAVRRSIAVFIGVAISVGVVDCGLDGQEFPEIAGGVMLITMPRV
jgi:hypothetical protein